MSVLDKIRGKTIRRVKLSGEYGDDDGPKPTLELWFTDGSWASIMIVPVMPTADISFAADSDADAVSESVKISRAR